MVTKTQKVNKNFINYLSNINMNTCDQEEGQTNRVENLSFPNRNFLKIFSTISVVMGIFLICLIVENSLILDKISSLKPISIVNPTHNPLTTDTPISSKTTNNPSTPSTPSTTKNLSPNGLVQTFSYHGDPIKALEWIKDKRLLVSGADDDKVIVWNVTTNVPLFVFDENNGGHTSAVNCVKYLGNNLVASGSDDSSIKVWDLSSGSLKFTLDKTNMGHTLPIYALALLSGNLLASGSLDSKIKLWDFNTGSLVRTFDSSNGGHSSFISSLARIDNGNLFASASDDNTLKIWSLTSLVFTLTGHSSQVDEVVYLGNQLLASGSADNTVKIWDTSTGRLKYDFDSTQQGHSRPVYKLAMLENNLLASGSGADFGAKFGEVKIWDLNLGKLKFSLDSATSGAHTLEVHALTSHGADMLISGSHDKTIKVN